MKRKTKWVFKAKHHADIWKAMQRVFADEKWNDTMNDRRLAAAVCDMGIYCTHTIARDIRLAHKVGNAEERKIILFAKQHKG